MFTKTGHARGVSTPKTHPVYFWISLAVSLNLLSSCGSNETLLDGFEKGAKVARLNISTEPPSLDPRIATDTTSASIINMLFEGLMRLDPKGQPKPAMARSVDISNDGKTYTFHLRDARWSNGDPVTATDFQKSWQQVVDPSFPANYAYQLHVLKNGKLVTQGAVSPDELGVKVIDQSTLVVELEHPTPYFLELLAHHVFAPVNQKLAQADPHWAMDVSKGFVGNGPFTLIRWDHHDEIVVKKSDTYWDKDQVKLSGIQISMVEDPSTELGMFQQGELDWAGQPLSLSLPLDAIPELRRRGQLRSQAIAGVYFYLFNTERLPFTNAKIRRAFSYAIGRQRIVDNVTQAGQQPAMGLVPPTMPFEQRPFFGDEDLNHAKRLFQEGLEELGMQAKDLPTLTLSYNTGDHHLKIAQAVQQQWYEAFGVRVELVAAEWKVYLSSLHQRDFMIGRLGWIADFNDPINFLEIFKYRDSGNNSTNWEDPDYIALLDQAAQMSNKRKRHETLVKAERILMHQMPLTPLFFITYSHVKNPKLKHVALSPLGSVDFKWASLE